MEEVESIFEEEEDDGETSLKKIKRDKTVFERVSNNASSSSIQD